ncbi:Rieske (2Fe-2S) protein [Aestuariibaculum marinum]|uniref:Rieske domain-containing protein n=1 Tax=Aestuariibaculum marinum TaxID=2683592 RepID=A0A8J6PZ69_9FLAO|nr:hypothetical protein [Aestuariibaculum marinum]MBD0823605.1 hypothetical protein [Aestuariibaculum marinum]
MKLLIYIFSLFLLISCSNNYENENCKFLLDINVNLSINLSLPEYDQLPFAGNSIYIPNYGNGGIIIASTGFDYYAWDARDPNHEQSSCSILEPSGLEATCGCNDQNKYSLVTGQAFGENAPPCSLRFYSVRKDGNILYISNN